MKRFVFLSLSLMLVSGCDWMPGKPTLAQKWRSPEDVVDFKDLYAQNCLACHGDGQSKAGSITLKNPVYLATIPRDTLRSAIANGVSGHNMPAFSLEAGGQLKDSQIDTLVNGILGWADPTKLPATPLPPYAAALGDVVSGKAAYAASCASCHGPDGTGGKAGSIVDKFYLNLVSDQYLRSVVIAGRPELGCPDFASRRPGAPMTNQAIADVVAWLAFQRVNEFDQPLSKPPAQR